MEEFPPFDPADFRCWPSEFMFVMEATAIIVSVACVAHLVKFALSIWRARRSP